MPSLTIKRGTVRAHDRGLVETNWSEQGGEGTKIVDFELYILFEWPQNGMFEVKNIIQNRKEVKMLGIRTYLRRPPSRCTFLHAFLLFHIDTLVVATDGLGVNRETKKGKSTWKNVRLVKSEKKKHK